MSDVETKLALDNDRTDVENGTRMGTGKRGALSSPSTNNLTEWRILDSTWANGDTGNARKLVPQLLVTVLTAYDVCIEYSSLKLYSRDRAIAY